MMLISTSFFKNKQSLTKDIKIMQCFQPDNNDNNDSCKIWLHEVHIVYNNEISTHILSHTNITTSTWISL